MFANLHKRSHTTFNSCSQNQSFAQRQQSGWVSLFTRNGVRRREEKYEHKHPLMLACVPRMNGGCLIIIVLIDYLRINMVTVTLFVLSVPAY